MLLLAAAPSFAQSLAGGLYGRVVTEDGSLLPGVTVTLTGVGAPLTTFSDQQGNFRFLNLSTGLYALRAELAGYGTSALNDIAVSLGQNAEVVFTLRPAVTETINVSAAPLLDTRRIATGTSVSQRELDQVPTVRDPWGLLQQAPGVLLDRINVGGSESGVQAQFVSKGASSEQATYNVEGINTTDMISSGSSSYYDFGAFEEVQITTGGTDPRVQTPGAQVNMVTRRGTNDIAGSLRYFLTPGSTQASRKIPAEARGYINKTTEVDEINEWGFELGGPLIRDRLWLWGSYGRNDIELRSAQSFTQSRRFNDGTSLETYNAKLNAQLFSENSLTFFWYDNEKEKIGRNESVSTPREATHYQSNYGPSGTYKLEDTHIFSPNFYLTGMYSHVNGGFQLIPHSGADCRTIECVRENATKAMVISAVTGTTRNTNVVVQSGRPQDAYRGDGTAFFSTAGLSHELKFGFGYREAKGKGTTFYPQNELIYDLSRTNGLPEGFGITYFYALSPYDYEFQYNDAYAGDTIAWRNLTLNVGVRYDRQVTRPGDQISPANTAVLDYLPAITYPAEGIPEYEWSSIVPRIGATYALGKERRTLLRGAYNRYVGQLGSSSSGYSEVVPGYRYVAFYTLDADGNDVITAEEVLYDYGVYDFSGFDINNPASTLQPSRVDPDASQPTTDEFMAGFEQEVLRDFVIGLNYTHRDFRDFLTRRAEKTRGGGDYYTSADYEVATILKPPPGVTEGGDYAVPVYQLKGGVGTPTYFVLTNRDGYSQTYDGLELTFTKRMTRRWSMRSHVTWSDWKQHIGPEAIIDPTRIRDRNGCSSCDGEQVVLGSAGGGGAKGGVWINSGWATNVAATVQIPRIETNVGLNFNMRQGYPLLYVHQHNLTNGEGSKLVLVNDVGSVRLPNPYTLDLRFAKELRYRGAGIELGIDIFNVTDRQTILQRASTLASRNGPSPTRNQIRELQNPRILRFGARVTF
ncbi:MAG TPA: TonB-dependent receptor [Thermoanaerobaculia bacterium]